jgi:hypothetical protein
VRIARPSAVTTVKPSTASRIVPYRTAVVPEARVAAMPPMVASAPGSSGNIRPVDCRCRSSCLRVTPASTVTSRSSTLRRSTRFIRVRSMLMPPRTGITCPSSDDPAPNGVIGHRSSAHAATMACTSTVDAGNTTASGVTPS